MAVSVDQPMEVEKWEQDEVVSMDIDMTEEAQIQMLQEVGVVSIIHLVKTFPYFPSCLSFSPSCLALTVGKECTCIASRPASVTRL